VDVGLILTRFTNERLLLAQFFEPVIKATRMDEPLDKDWKPGGPWKPIKRHIGVNPDA
jgi:hypothetical protein